MILMKGPSWVAVAISFVILMALSLVYESKKKFFIGDMRISLILYISTVIFFASVGVGTFLRLGTLGSALLAIGGILFAVSDNDVRGTDGVGESLIAVEGQSTGVSHIGSDNHA